MLESKQRVSRVLLVQMSELGERAGAGRSYQVTMQFKRVSCSPTTTRGEAKTHKLSRTRDTLSPLCTRPILERLSKEPFGISSSRWPHVVSTGEISRQPNGKLVVERQLVPGAIPVLRMSCYINLVVSTNDLPQPSRFSTC